MKLWLVGTVIAAYFALLYAISVITSRGAGNSAFFLGERKSPWYICLLYTSDAADE